MIRLDKFLTQMNLGSRTQIKEAAKKGRILVNGVIEKKTDRKIDPENDEIAFDGEPIVYEAFGYYMLHKPAGTVSATHDHRHKTVMDLFPSIRRTDLFPVGRLDLDTEGLLLITNDGDLAHRLLSPKKHVDKVYVASVKGNLKKEYVSLFAEGILLEDGTKLLPATLEIIKTDDLCNEVKITICEGKFHQIKRMFEAVSCEVTYLKRLSMGSLTLDETLPLGKFRSLTSQEYLQLKGETL